MRVLKRLAHAHGAHELNQSLPSCRLVNIHERRETSAVKRKHKCADLSPTQTHTIIQALLITTLTITRINYPEQELGQGIVGCLDEQPSSKTNTSGNGHASHLRRSSLGGSRRRGRRRGRGGRGSNRGSSRGSTVGSRRGIRSQGAANVVVSIRDIVEQS
jgi:hypothetical protein